MSYAPTPNVQCPPDADLLRSTPTGPSQSLHPNETSYIQTRQEKVVLDAWKSWLGDGSGIGYKLSDFKDAFPRVGIAVSGGGYRAAQYGAGSLSALDARNQTAKNAGTGGLLQVSSYLSGVSGGSWLLTSIVFNDLPTMHDLVLGNDKLHGWLLDIDLLIPGGGNIFNQENQWVYGAVLDQVYKKADAGFDTSITDPWARLLGYHFLNGTTRDNFFTNDSAHGAGVLWSDIPKVPSFSNYQMPLPLVVADSRPAKSGYNGTTAQLNWVVYEFSPFEFGSWDPDVSAFTDVAVTGTHLNSGEPDGPDKCVKGFDQATFVMGTSSSLFNVCCTCNTAVKRFADSPGRALVDLLRRLTSRVQTNADDVANWPNSFLGHKVRDFIDGARLKLELIDGGSNQENIPIGPLLVDARGVDTIVALDGTDEDDNSWPMYVSCLPEYSGRAIYATRNRTRNFLDSTHQPMPPLPANFPDFANFGLNRRPTFFGCDPKNNPPEFPMLIYLPNMPPYTEKHTSLFLDSAQTNIISGFLPGKTGADPNFPKCLQCAAVDRARYKQNSTTVLPRSDFCTTCFKQYCFDTANPPSAKDIVGRKLKFKNPDPSIKSFVQEHRIPLAVGVAGGVVVIAVIAAIV
ncbi:lysophospholipase [Exidia glandulosa HHB12029]|uniref:Lysophospholipase n=1 Tax=Exidia glandulosa HHB12029 TaxID=1314781 RepID=A0A165ECE5_EXIGL|nr:lysophospholipase [Exidia glandulosa HHB12029]